MNTLNDVNRYFYFGVICFIGILYALLVNIYYLNYDVIYQTFIDQLSEDRISQVLETSKRWAWISLMFVPFLLMTRILYTTLCLSVGNMLLYEQVNFKTNFSISLRTEVVFSVMLIAKLFIFGFIKVPADLIELNKIPLSLYDLLKHDKLQKWLIYPLQTVNVWEMIYCLFLAKLLCHDNNKSFLANLFFVLYTYGIGLLIWILIVVFFTISFS